MNALPATDLLKTLFGTLSVWTFCSTGAASSSVSSPPNPPNSSRPLNFLLFIADDLGYGDLGCFGNSTIATPNIDKLASEGVRLTHSIAADTMCTPSRAALLTGRYPIRSGMASSTFMRVTMFTASNTALPVNETTIGDVAKQAGYRTALLGKWHQGWSVDRSDPDHAHPLNNGFDYFYGLPLSNCPDFGEPGHYLLLTIFPSLPLHLLLVYALMFVSAVSLTAGGMIPKWPAVFVLLAFGIAFGGTYWAMLNMKVLNSFMFRNYEIVEQPIDLATVTRKLVHESNEFLADRHKDNIPFMLVISWLHVHTALKTAPRFRNSSLHGPYGDAVQELDWGVGQVLETLRMYGMEKNTFVYFTSRQTMALTQDIKTCMGILWAAPTGLSVVRHTREQEVEDADWPRHGGKADGSTEGSFRVPGIVRWPGRVEAGRVITEPVSLMDILPTMADLLKVTLPSDGHVTDGRSLVALLTGKEKESPHEFLFHYCQDQIHAIRYRPQQGGKVWKLNLREPNPGTYNDITRRCNDALHLTPAKLYDLTSDPIAATPIDLSEQYTVVGEMFEGLHQHRLTLSRVPQQFTWARWLWRPWKQPCCNFPVCACEDAKFIGQFSG